MNTRNEKDYLRRKNRILESARSLILEKGFKNISLRQIAKKAGYSPASLYEYFESKQMLISELAIEVNKKLNDKLMQVNAENSREKLINLGFAYFDFALQNTEDFQLAFNSMESQRHSFSQKVPKKTAYGQVLSATKKYLEEKGGASDEETEIFAYGLWSLVHGAAMLQLGHLKNFELKEGSEMMIRKIIELYLS